MHAAQGRFEKYQWDYSLNCMTQGPMDHFTVVCSVAWPLDGTDARVGLVLIQTSLLLSCKCTWLASEQLVLHNKSSEVCIKTRSTLGLLSSKGQVTEQTTVKWSIIILQITNFEIKKSVENLFISEKVCSTFHKYYKLQQTWRRKPFNLMQLMYPITGKLYPIMKIEIEYL